MSEANARGALRGNGDIEVVEVDRPEPGAGEVLLRVHSCALCGRDRDGYLNGSAVIPGHEVSGVIAVVGEEVSLARGTPGVVYLVGYCGRCYCCKANLTNMCIDKQQMYGFTDDGGFADYVVVRADCFLKTARRFPWITPRLCWISTGPRIMPFAGRAERPRRVCWWWAAAPSGSVP